MVTAFRSAGAAAMYSSTGVNMGTNGVLGFWLQEVINAVSGNLDRPGGAMFPKAAAFAANTMGRAGQGKGVTTGRRQSRVAKAPEVYAYVRKRLDAGEQAYVVVPAVEESVQGLKDVASHARFLAEGPFRGLAIESVHGRMDRDQREAAMARFYVTEPAGEPRARLYATLYTAFGVMSVALPLVAGAILALAPLSASLRVAVFAGLASVIARSLLKMVQERRRAAGEVKGYNASFTRQDRSRFLQAMDAAVQIIKRRR